MSTASSESAHLGLLVPDLKAANAYWTAREIAQQPGSWRKTLASLQAEESRWQDFLGPILGLAGLRIILTGAGSSAFIGECLAPILAPVLGRVEAIATTDLLSGPHLYLQPDVPTLLVSFARSGNSPESLAVVELAQGRVKRCHQLVFTCNEQGALYRHCHERDGHLAILLPPETHDQSFAMTSSFSSMLLAAYLVLAGGGAKVDVADLARAVQVLIDASNGDVQQLAQRGFSRVVYLGSNNLRGIAREAALKLLELTDGQVVAVHDSPLGFRHGPKTIVTADTLVVVFISNDPQARAYDLDLLRELRTEGRAGRVIALSARSGDEALRGDHVLVDGFERRGDEAWAFACVVWAQLYAFHRSRALGLAPDRPSVSGTVNRVVSGVTIHPVGS